MTQFIEEAENAKERLGALTERTDTPLHAHRSKSSDPHPDREHFDLVFKALGELTFITSKANV